MGNAAKHAFIIQVKASANPLDTTALEAQLARISTGTDLLSSATDLTDDYYRTDDRYNGKEYTPEGAWNELIKSNGPLEKARKQHTTQGEVDAAVSALKAAIDKLIPKTRVNPTLLYEALNKKWYYSAGTALENLDGINLINADNTTAVTWAPYAAAKAEGEELLAALYDESGEPTEENTAAKQQRIEALAASLDATKLVEKEFYDSVYKYYLDNRTKAFDLLEQYELSKYTPADYTAESWAKFEDAYKALEADMKYSLKGGTREDLDMLFAFRNEVDDDAYSTQGHIDLLKKTARLLVSAKNITIDFAYVNNYTAKYPYEVHGDYQDVLIKENLQLTNGSTTVKDALDSSLISINRTNNEIIGSAKYGLEDFDCDILPEFMVFINGEFITLDKEDAIKKIQLHDGDKVKVTRVFTPGYLQESAAGLEASTTELLPSKDEEQYMDSISDTKLTVPAGVIKVGDEVELSASVTGAHPLSENFGKQLDAANITLFVSEPGELELEKQPTINTGVKTGENGKLSYVFTEPGVYTVALFDIEPDDPASEDMFMVSTPGSYNCVNSGDFAVITVVEPDDEAALIASYGEKFKAEAKAYFDEFHDYDFVGDSYEKVFVPAYELISEHIASAKSFKTLVDTYRADFAALMKIGEKAIDHRTMVEDLRKRMGYLPEDAAKLDTGYAETLNGIKSDFAAMNNYTKSLFTPAELARLAEIAAIDVSKLNAQATVTVTFQEDEDLLKLFQKYSGTGNPYYGKPNLNWVITPAADGSLSNPVWATLDWYTSQTAKTRDHVYARRYAPVLSDEQYWLMWSVDDGASWNEAQRITIYTPNDAREPYYYFLVDYIIPDDAVNGSIIDMQLKSISRAEYDALVLDGVRADAKRAVEAAFEEYSKNANADRAKLEQIKTDALTAIAAATTQTDVTEARKTAVAAMAAAVRSASGNEGGSGEPDTHFDSGRTVGTVSLLIENTTFGDAPFVGTIAEGTYPLGENDTMMTVVLKALEAKGFNWNGTLGDLGNAGESEGEHDYTITYLGSINKGEGAELGEFDGGQKSGWMGTLNDWFVNESFSAFGVANGKLESGDEIHVMYTCDLGADIGGTWAAADTALSSLSFSSGRLAPAFASDVSDYMLILPSASANLKVDYKVRNMNYQSRMYLNYYNKDSARYKKSDIVPVKTGDKLYIGIGDPTWPSMNNSGRGMKYVVSVCTLDDAIGSLPAKSAVKLSNYKSYEALVEQLETIMKDYGYSGGTDKLSAVKEAIAFYTEIDAVKALLDAVPVADRLVTGDKVKVEAAKAAYDALSDEQKMYITVADANKYNAAVDWLEKQGISTGGHIEGSAETPEEKEEEQPAVSETLTVEAKTDANGVAKATIEANAVTEVIKNAAASKADSIIIKPEVTGDAKEVKVELPKASVSEIAKSSVALVVETDKGSVEVPNEVLKEIAEQAGGANVEISVADKSVEDAGVKAAIADKIGDADTANAAVAEITVSSGDEKITSFGGKSINASVSVEGKKNFTAGRKYLTLVISSNGKRELLAGKCSRGEDGKLSVGVKVKHLSTFVVLDKELQSFADADAHWSADAVDFAVANGLMNGVSDKAFAPNSTLNRAMLVTILYRLAGKPAVAEAAKFTDVAAGEWYTDAVAWAAANGIVTGKTETSFAPMENITREQFATMLMRYCKFAGIDTASSANLGAFADSASISAYAKDALAWANASGIITGRTATTIAPTGSATRGEAATMLMRFMQL